MRTKYSQNLSGASSKTAGRAALVLDVGTTGVKAFVFGEDERVLSRASLPLSKSFPQKEWVEQDPFQILAVSKRVLQEALSQSGQKADDIARFGIANQRETTILWGPRYRRTCLSGDCVGGQADQNGLRTPRANAR